MNMIDIDSIDLESALDDVLSADNMPEAKAVEKPAPFLLALPVDQLFADHTYQRELDAYRVSKMAADYQVALIGIIEVSKRAEDWYAILDGQHRWATARDVAFGAVTTPHIVCRVHTELTVAEEAALYHQLNTTRRQLTGWDRWLARRGAGDRDVLDIERLLARHDLKVALAVGGNVFRATRTAEKLVELGGLSLLDEVVGVARSAWPNDQNGMDSTILHGLGHVLNSYTRDELDLARLTQELAGILPRQLSARAAAVRELHKGTMDRLAAHVIVERYNASKGPRLEPFFSRVKPVSKARTSKEKSATEQRNRVRAWAVQEGLMKAGASGRIRRSVQEAYDAAHPAGRPS